MQLWLFFCIDNCCRCFHLALSFLIGFILTSVTKTIDPQSIRWFIKVAHERTKKIAVSRHIGWMILWLGFKVAAIISKRRENVLCDTLQLSHYLHYISIQLKNFISSYVKWQVWKITRQQFLSFIPTKTTKFFHWTIGNSKFLWIEFSL